MADNSEDAQDVVHSDGDSESGDSFGDDAAPPLNGRDYYENTETHSAWRHNIPHQPSSFESDSEEEEDYRNIPARVRFIHQSKPTSLHYREDEEDEEDEEEENIDEDGELTPDQERKIIRKLESNAPSLRKGDTWYILDNSWYQVWKQYTKINDPTIAARPGPIDNSSLLQPGTQLIKLTVTENINYLTVSKDLWDKLYSWYGGGPVIARPVIATGIHNTLSIEVRQLELKFVRSSQPTKVETAFFSKADTVRTVKEKMCPVLGVEPDQVRLWDYHNQVRSTLLDLEKTLVDSHIITGQHVLFEEKLKNGEWPEKPQRTTGWGYSYSYNTGREPSPPGKCGLSNLGNTCFMNSSLQSLSNNPILTGYFLSNKYKDELNRDNPLGTGGKLADQFAKLMKDMWSGEYSFIAPRDFKFKLERFAPQFQGMQQHDSQELLAFLLDGLHEDLNRVRQKPYVELQEANGRPDEVVAQEAWRNHLARNDSIIVDWFHGQLKSTLVCPDCDRVSITFDPFMYLSLPLPVSSTKNITVHYVPENPEQAHTRYLLEVPKAGTILDLKKALCALVPEIVPNNLAVTYACNNRITRLYRDNDSLDSLHDTVFNVYYVDFEESDSPAPAATSSKSRGVMDDDDDDDDDEYVYKPNTHYSGSYYSYGGTQYTGNRGYSASSSYYASEGSPDDLIHLSVVFRREFTRTYHSAYYRPTTETQLFGVPFILSVRRGISYNELYAKVKEKISAFLRDTPLDIPPQPSNQYQTGSSSYGYNTGSSDYYGRSSTSYGQGSTYGSNYSGSSAYGGDRYYAGGVTTTTYREHRPSTTGYGNTYTGSSIGSGTSYSTQQYGSIYSRSTYHHDEEDDEDDDNDDDNDNEDNDNEDNEDSDEKPKEDQDADGVDYTTASESQQDDGLDSADSPAESGLASAKPALSSKPVSLVDDPRDSEESTSDDNDVSTSDEDGEPEEDDEPEAEQQDEDQPEPHIFTLGIVDQIGQRVIRTLEEGSPLRLRDRETLGLTFTTENYQRWYKNDAETNYVKHPSMDKEELDEDETVELTQCLDLYTEKEQLGPDDPWYCNVCKDHKQATKKFDLWKLPAFLVIHLKRFSYKNRYWRDKLECLVKFPLENLDLSEYQLCKEGVPPVYDLMAVSNHFGALGGGHYTAFAKHANLNCWYKFDDSNVSQINDSAVCSTAAYVLFYRRKDTYNWETPFPAGELKYIAPAEPEPEPEPEPEEDSDDEDDRYGISKPHGPGAAAPVRRAPVPPPRPQRPFTYNVNDDDDEDDEDDE